MFKRVKRNIPVVVDNIGLGVADHTLEEQGHSKLEQPVLRCSMGCCSLDLVAFLVIVSLRWVLVNA